MYSYYQVDIWLICLFYFIKEERIAEKINSDEASVLFLSGCGIILFAGVLFYAYKPSGWGENPKQGNRSNYREGSRDRWNGFSDSKEYPNDGYDESGW